MGLRQLLALESSTERLCKMARRIADRCRDEVAQRVNGRTAGMTDPERRGYIRARSAVVVQRETAAVMAEDPRLREVDREALRELAMNAVIATANSAPTALRQRRAA